jgi:hypothetical protein
MMLVPDPRKASQKVRDRVAHAFNSIKKRKALFFLSERRLRTMSFTQAGKQDELAQLSDLCELDMPDRRELDDAVLEMLGVESKKRRNEILDELYAYLKEFYELTRQKEEKAIQNKNKSRRRGAARPSEIASQILAELKENEPRWFKHYRDFIDLDKPYDSAEIPEDGDPEIHTDLFTGNSVRFKGRGKLVTVEVKSEVQSHLVLELALSGVRGLVRIPHKESDCRSVYEEYRRFIDDRNKRLWQLVENRTADEDMQEKVYEGLILAMRKAVS